MNMQTFLLYLLITVLMAPLLIVYGLPFIIVARGVRAHRPRAHRRSPASRDRVRDRGGGHRAVV